MRATYGKISSALLKMGVKTYDADIITYAIIEGDPLFTPYQVDFAQQIISRFCLEKTIKQEDGFYFVK